MFFLRGLIYCKLASTRLWRDERIYYLFNLFINQVVRFSSNTFIMSYVWSMKLDIRDHVFFMSCAIFNVNVLRICFSRYPFLNVSMNFCLILRQSSFQWTRYVSLRSVVSHVALQHCCLARSSLHVLTWPSNDKPRRVPYLKRFWYWVHSPVSNAFALQSRRLHLSSPYQFSFGAFFRANNLPHSVYSMKQ
jgi:hypothetical protein